MFGEQMWHFALHAEDRKDGSGVIGGVAYVFEVGECFFFFGGGVSVSSIPSVFIATINDPSQREEGSKWRLF